MKAHERSTISEHVLFVSIHQSRVAKGVMLPMVKCSLSVCLSVCYQLVNALLQNEGTNFNTNWHKSSPGEGHGRSTLGVMRSKVKVRGDRSYVWKPGGDIILNPLSRVDRCIQWAMEMLPLKGGGYCP